MALPGSRGAQRGQQGLGEDAASTGRGAIMRLAGAVLAEQNAE